MPTLLPRPPGRPGFGGDRRRGRPRPAVLRRAAATCIALALAMAGPGGNAWGGLPTGPAAGDMDLSPFYRWDGPLPAEPGVLLRQETLPAQPGTGAAAAVVRILYTSTDARWHSGRIAVSGTLFLPSGTPPRGGWPLLAWAHGTLGIADACAPSWTGFRPRDATYLDRWLAAGFAVVATDYQGLGGPGPHPYLHWPSEGRSVLDAARAALLARPGLVSNRTLVAGQSQGAGAALGAGRLAREYAPELNVLGVAATGLNSTFPDGPVPLPARDTPNMFLSLASGGLRDDAPPIDRLLSPKGRQLLEAARQGCTKELGMLARKLEVRGLPDTLSVSLEGLAPMRMPLTDMPVGAIGVPVLVGTGLADQTIPPMRQYAAVAALCAASGDITWRRYDGLGHDGALHGSFDDTLGFARSLLAGRKPQGNCATVSPPGPPGERREDAPFNDD